MRASRPLSLLLVETGIGIGVGFALGAGGDGSLFMHPPRAPRMPVAAAATSVFASFMTSILRSG
jgi:hypothetical protein